MAKEKKAKKDKKPSYLKEVKNEMKKVIFPSAKEVAKYTFATIFMVVLLVGFFQFMLFLLAWLNGVV